MKEEREGLKYKDSFSDCVWCSLTPEWDDRIALVRHISHSVSKNGEYCMSYLWFLPRNFLEYYVLSWFRYQSKRIFQATLAKVETSRTIQPGFPGGSIDKESTCNAGDMGSIPGLGRYPGEGNGNPFQYSCRENAWTEEPGGLLSTGLHRVGHDRKDLAAAAAPEVEHNIIQNSRLERQETQVRLTQVQK